MSEHEPAVKAREAVEALIREAETWRQAATGSPIYGKNQRGETVLIGYNGNPPMIDGHPIEYWHNIATATLKTNNELIDRVKALTQERDDQKINADHYFATRERIERENYTLRQSLKEKERINADLETRYTFAETSLRTAEAVEKALQAKIADLEQQLKSAEIAAQTVEEKREKLIREMEVKLADMTRQREEWRKKHNHQYACAVKVSDERDTALRELDAMREKMKLKEWPMRRYTVDGVEVSVEAFYDWERTAPNRKISNRREGWTDGQTTF